MPSIIPPVPPGSPIGSYQWADWYEKVRRAINNAGNIKYSQITDFTGSNLVNLQTRSHQDLQNILGPTGARGHVPTGGTTGQVLAKVSATDYDYAWTTGGGGVSLSTVNVFTKNQSVAPSTLTDAATITPDASLSNNFYLPTTAAVGATRAIANPTNTTNGMVLNLEVVQPASGGPCALTFGTKFKWGLGGLGTQPTGSVTASSSDFYSGYVQANGDIHIVLIGQAGPTGPAGTTGATGATGATGPTGPLSNGVNLQTGTTYTYVVGDLGKLVSHSNAAAIAATLPQATGSFTSPFIFAVENTGVGTLTITPTTSTIDGATLLALTTNQGCIIYSNGTNWYTMRGVGSAGGGGGSGTAIYGTHAFRVYQSATQSYTSGFLKLNYDTILQDDDNGFSTTNKRYTCVTPGTWIIHGFTYVTSTTYLRPTIYVNGVEVNSGLYSTPNASGTGIIPYGALVKLQVGDYVEIFINGGAGFTINAGAAYNYFQGALISSASGGVPIAKTAGNGSGDITNATTSLADVTGMSVSIKASVGDILEIEALGSVYITTTANSSPTTTFKVNTTDLTAQSQQESFASVGFALPWIHRIYRTVVAGDLSSGVVNIQLRFKAQSTSSPVLWQNNSSVVGVISVKNYGDGSGITSNSSASPVLLGTVAGINAKTVAATTLYTVPAGKTAYISAAAIRVNTASAITAGPTCDVYTTTAGDIFASTALTALTATPKVFFFTSVGMSITASAAATIKLNITAAATGTSQTVDVDLIGYLK